jgi:hypothetical protein
MASVVKGNVMETKNEAERLVLEALTDEAIVARVIEGETALFEFRDTRCTRVVNAVMAEISRL